MNKIRRILLVDPSAAGRGYYAAATVPGLPSAPTFAALLKGARKEALRVQRGDHWADEEEAHPFEARAGLHQPDRSKKAREKRRHMRAAGASAEEMRLATTAQGPPGRGDCPKSLYAAMPRVPRRPRDRLSCSRAPRPSFPLQAWIVEHRRRCHCLEQRAAVTVCPFRYLLTALRDGWEVPMAYEPESGCHANYPSALAEPQVIEAFLDALVSKGRAWPLPAGRHAIIESAMGIVYRLADVGRVKPRVTVDATASGVNATAPPWKFSYLTVASFLDKIGPGWWLVSIDLEAYYNQLPLHPRSQPYVAVRWGGTTYVLSSVPFGISSAPAFASFVAAELHQMFVALGIPAATVLLDDHCFGFPSQSLAATGLEMVLAVLERLGVIVNGGKTTGPTQRLEHLGIVIDTVQATVSMSLKKREAFYQQLLAAASATEVREGDLLSIGGRLQWFSQIAPSLRWSAQAVRAGVSPAYRRHSTSTVPVDAATQDALRRAASTLVTYPHTPILTWKGFSGPPVLLRCDASGTGGLGGHVGMAAFAAPGSFVPWYYDTHNMVARELLAAVYALQHVWSGQWRGRIVVLCMDNEGAVLAWLSGRSDNALTQLVLRMLHDIVEQEGVYLLTLWIPRELNIVSDFLSHFNRCWKGTIIVGPAQQISFSPPIRQGGDGHDQVAAGGSGGQVGRH